MEVMNLIIGLLGAGIGSGLMMIVQALLQRKWQKEDKENNQLSAQTKALRVMMVDRIRCLSHEYIDRGYISVDDKATLHAMYVSYKGLGGDGHLDMIKSVVDKLEVK